MIPGEKLYGPTRCDVADTDPVPPDDVNRPAHYNNHPSGVECVQIAEHHDFCIGNVIKYCWRAGLKTSGNAVDDELKDLRKARWYLDRKIARLEARVAGKGGQ